MSCQSAPVHQDADNRLDSEDSEDLGFSLDYPDSSDSADLPASVFGEIWGYLISGEEQTLKANLPLSDIGYFGAEVDSYGQLANVPNRKKISFFPGRAHLVVKCDGRALTHFAIEPGSRVRRQLVADILEAAKPFDGLQIDFENILQRDGEPFRSFLSELRAGLGDKLFTVALPARIRRQENDAFDYQKILPLVDRILVMAYDEHWSTSKPGPIASLPWCKNVADYALKTIGPEKLVMGLPFYGRSWGDVNANRAFFYSGIQRIKRENETSAERRENGIPTFNYETTLNVTVYYEDAHSLSARLQLYRDMGIKAVGFWRLGQETPAIWDLLELKP
jgi:spore germination protein YaaH